MRNEIIEGCIEKLCGLGCREVRLVIARLAQSEPVLGTEGLSAPELAVVLEELRAVMSVYDARPAGGDSG
jgi:hypothetical protein